MRKGTDLHGQCIIQYNNKMAANALRDTCASARRLLETQRDHARFCQALRNAQDLADVVTADAMGYKDEKQNMRLRLGQETRIDVSQDDFWGILLGYKEMEGIDVPELLTDATFESSDPFARHPLYFVIGTCADACTHRCTNCVRVYCVLQLRGFCYTVALVHYIALIK